MILMNSSIRKREKKEETHNNVIASTGGGMNTPIMQKPTKWLLQQPATQPPPFCPLIPTSQLLFPGLPRLETEGLKIIDQESFLPSPGEPQNWSYYGVYLLRLSAYNATEIQVSHNISSFPNPNSANRIATPYPTPNFSKTSETTSKSSASLSSSTPSSLSLSALAPTKPKITKESKTLQGQGIAKLGYEEEKEKTVAKSKEGLKRTNGKRKGKALTEQQKVKQRASYQQWYERNKGKRKVYVLTEEQKVKQQAYYKKWYERNKGKRKLTERQSK